MPNDEIDFLVAKENGGCPVTVSVDQDYFACFSQSVYGGNIDLRICSFRPGRKAVEMRVYRIVQA